MQGDFAEHIATFGKCKTEVICREVRKTEQLDGLDGLGSLSVSVSVSFLSSPAHLVPASRLQKRAVCALALPPSDSERDSHSGRREHRDAEAAE